MNKQNSLQGSLDLLVLKILSRRPQSHGYAIMAAVGRLSGDVLVAEESRRQAVTSAVNRVLRTV
jgi:PadR family transcriptional regulator PadR